MAQAGPVVWGRFREPIRQYKAPPACACTEEFYETDPRNDFIRGYALQTVAPLPIAMAHLIAEEDGMYGEALLERMQDYNHYAAIGVLGEILPDPRNFVSLHPTEKDQFGIPLPYAHFNLFENDRRLMEAGISRARAVLEAAGATETHSVNRYAHLVGTCRMGFTPRDSVVDQWCRYLGRAQPAGLRRERAADPGLVQPGPDHLRTGGAHGGLAAPSGSQRGAARPSAKELWRCMAHDCGDAAARQRGARANPRD